MRKYQPAHHNNQINISDDILLLKTSQLLPQPMHYPRSCSIFLNNTLNKLATATD